MADGETAPRERWPWWRAERWVIVAVALLIGIVAFQTDREADELDDEVAALQADADTIDAREARALRQASGPVLGAYDVDAIVADLLSGNLESSRAARAMTVALNSAVDRANAGDLAGLHRIAQEDGGAALDRLRATLGPQARLLARIERAWARARDDRPAGA
jgi:hypothetical protein